MESEQRDIAQDEEERICGRKVFSVPTNGRKTNGQELMYAENVYLEWEIAYINGGKPYGQEQNE